MIYGDNEGAVAQTKNDCYHARTKHSDIRYHYVRERAEENSVKVESLRTDANGGRYVDKGRARGETRKILRRYRVAMASGGVIILVSWRHWLTQLV